MNFNILRVANVIMDVTDLEKAYDFYVNALGFIVTERDEHHLYLRGLEEHSHHSLVLRQSHQTGVRAIGYKVSSEDDLYALEAAFRTKGLPVKWIPAGTEKGVGKKLRTQDIAGVPLEFFCQVKRVERLLQRFDLYRGARIQRIDHVNVFVPDVEAMIDFYRDELGFRMSEYTVTEDERYWAAWMFRKPNVHDLAFTSGLGPRLHHVAFYLPDPMSVIHCCDVLASLGYAPNIERGPGRHGVSNAFFLYLRDPDGNRVELYTGDYLTIDPDFEPIRWEIDDPRRGTFWGTAVPDSWFTEGVPFYDLEEKGYVQLEEAVLGSRKPDFIL